MKLRLPAIFSKLARNDAAWLAFYICVVLAFPVVLGHTTLQPPDFDPAPIARLRQENPDVILIGDSMLESRIDPALLSKLSGRRISFLQHNGSASGKWFLYLKNYIAASGVNPDRVIIFFRDRYLTDPTFRLKGAYLENLYPAMRPDEPVVEAFLDETGTGPFAWLENWIEEAYPSEGLRDPVATAIVEEAQDATDEFLPGEVDFEDELDETFDLRNLRKDVPSDLASADLNKDAFDPSPTVSFLPHMMRVARESSLRVSFFRVKRRPGKDGVRKESQTLTRYMSALREYLDANGASLIDETPDPRIGLDLYGDGDHIAEDKRARYTELFFEGHKELFE